MLVKWAMRLFRNEYHTAIDAPFAKEVALLAGLTTFNILFLSADIADSLSHFALLDNGSHVSSHARLKTTCQVKRRPLLSTHAASIDPSEHQWIACRDPRVFV